MITVKQDRKAFIPECDRCIGFENDNLVEKRYFEVCIPEICDFSFKLDVKNTLDIIDLKKISVSDEKCVLLWNVTSNAIGGGGTVAVQLRAFDRNGEKVWHSSVMEFVAKPSVNAEKSISDERILTEFEQLEARTTTAVETAEAEANKASALANSALTYSENARIFAEKSEVGATKSAESAKNAQAHAEQAGLSFDEVKRVADEFSADTEKLGELMNTATEHALSRANPHGVTASQVGSYSKAESDGLLAEKADRDELFFVESKELCDLEYTVPEGVDGVIENDCVSAVGAKADTPIVIHCKGMIFGCKFEASGPYFRVTVNKNAVIDNTEVWSYGNASYILKPTFMTEDLEIAVDMSSIYLREITLTRSIGSLDAERFCSKKADAVHAHAPVKLVDLSDVVITHYTADGTESSTSTPEYDKATDTYLFPCFATYSEFRLFGEGAKVELEFYGGRYSVNGETHFGSYNMPFTELISPIFVTIDDPDSSVSVKVIQPKSSDGFMTSDDKAKLMRLEKAVAELERRIGLLI